MTNNSLNTELLPLSQIKSIALEVSINERVSNDKTRRNYFLQVVDGIATVGGITAEFKQDKAILDYKDNKQFSTIDDILNYFDHHWSVFELLIRAGISVEDNQWQSPVGELNKQVTSKAKDQKDSRQETAFIYSKAKNWAQKAILDDYIVESVKRFFVGTSRQFTIIKIDSISEKVDADIFFGDNIPGQLMVNQI